MPLTYTYKPFLFFLLTFLGTWTLGFIAAYFSHKGNEKFLFLGIFGSLVVPFIVTLVMIYASENQGLISDFWNRVFLFKITPTSLLWIFLLMPCVLFLATGISLLLGGSTEQFHLAKEFNVLKGWHILSLVIPFVLAPMFEELGWRGYGVDSLRANFNLFTTSLLFGVLWGVWHLPLFFIKGYYQYTLWDQGLVYVINFFVSVLPVAFLTNWIFYENGRSIPAIILFHSVLNIFSVIFRTEQFTKCIITLLLCVVSIFVILTNKDMFFCKT